MPFATRAAGASNGEAATMTTDTTTVPTHGQGTTILALIEASVDTAQCVPFDDAGADLGFTVTPETRADLDRIIPMLKEAHRVLELAAERELPRANAYYCEHEVREVAL